MGYAHLHVHSHYSFLDGASSVEDLADAAVACGMEALALTDTHGLYGAVRFWSAARERGLRPIVGCELRLVGVAGAARGTAAPLPLVLLARDRTGWTNLCRIVSEAQLAGRKGAPRATFETVARHPEGLFALTSIGDRPTVERLATTFGRSLYLELTDHLEAGDAERCDRLAALAAELGLGTVVTNDVRYARPDARRLHDVLRCIDLRTTLDEAGHRLAANGERWLKPEHALREQLGRHAEGFANAADIASRCSVDLDFGYQRLPGFTPPDGRSPSAYLASLCADGAREKYERRGKMSEEVTRKIAHELGVIERCGLAEFFLINWDISRFCRAEGIPAQGRGSAADSIVAYVLDITKVDPIEHDLLFERFLTEDARTMPDIDIDIATRDRERVIQYVYKKYGERHAAMVCNVVTYRARSAAREVAKALGFRPRIADRLGRATDVAEIDTLIPHSRSRRDYGHWDGIPEVPGSTEHLVAEMNESERRRLPLFREMVEAIADFPRHLSIHSGGMLITALPLVDTVPIERARMPGRLVAQFDKRDIEDLGLVKMDLLGLRTLSLVKEAVETIEREHGARLTLGSLPLDDPAVYDLLCEVDTIGLFQVESRAQAQALPRVAPRCFADIVIQVAIIRPGPLQGNMVNPFIRRRQGREPVTYAHPALEPILGQTLGVILFQEQILRVAMAVARFSAAEADGLRRAISRARSSRDMERLRGPFVAGALANGLSEETAGSIFDQIKGFAEFGFCKSHAAAFALTAYHTAHLKLYYPAEFYVALLNNQPMGFYSPAVIAGDAKRHGIQLLPVDVNASPAQATVERAAARGDVRDESVTIARRRACREHHIRLGLGAVKSVSAAEAEAIVAERERGGAFRSFEDFARRVALKEEGLRNLTLVGAFDAFGEPRRELLWRARQAHQSSPAFARRTLAFPGVPGPLLPELTERERTALDYRLSGIPIGPQVLTYYRAALRARGVLTSAQLNRTHHDDPVLVAGAVVVKQHPMTAKGHVFLSLEDEHGLANVILRPATYAACKPVLDAYAAVVVGGMVQQVDGVTSVLARTVEALELFVPIAVHAWQ